ncbi:MAG: histidine kinase [Frankiaceae bacterium]
MAARRLSEAGPAAAPEVLRMLSEASGCAVALREARIGPDTAGVDEADDDVLRVPLRGGQRLAGVLELTPAPPANSPWAAGSLALSLFADVLAMSVRCARTAANARTGAGQFLLAEEADRAQLAEGLHDGLVQALVAARYLIDLALQPGAENSPVAPVLDDAREAVRDALAEARHLLGWLRPRPGNNVPVVSEVESVVRREADRSPAASVVLSVDPSADIPVPPVVAAAAYRLVQCAVDSAHARMRDDRPTCRPDDGDDEDDRLRIGIRCHSGSLQLTFPAALADGSCAAMARWLDRAKLLGGSARIERGALVVRLPVEPDPDLAPRLPAQRYEGYL